MIEKELQQIVDSLVNLGTRNPEDYVCQINTGLLIRTLKFVKTQQWPSDECVLKAMEEVAAELGQPCENKSLLKLGRDFLKSINDTVYPNTDPIIGQ